MARWGNTDALWGTFVWGEEVITGILSWEVEIDWDRDNLFNGENEASRMFSISRDRGRKSMLQNTGSGFQKIPPGRCNIRLRNNDGRYNGWNQSSPLYPYVTYGPEVRIRVYNQATGITHNYFYGSISDIRTFGYGGDAYVEIEIEDKSRKLRDANARVAISQNVAPGTAIEAVLDAAGWENRWGRNIDTGNGTINYHWASGSKKAWSEIEDIAQSFLGIFFISADGKARFIDRNSTPTVVADLTQSVLLKDVSLPQPWYNQRTVSRLKAHPRRLAANGVIYRVEGDPILVEAGSRRTIWPNYSYNGKPVPAMNVLQPVGGVDYFAYANSDGSGADYTANCQVTLTDFGDNAKMVIVNTGGTNFWVTERQVQGAAIYEEDLDDITYPEDVSTVADQRDFVLNLLWQQSANAAFDYSQVLGAFLADLHPFPVVKMQGRPELQFAFDLFDVANLDLNELGVVGESFRVGGISDKSMGDNCQDMLTTFYLEPYLTSGTYWTWPIADFGTDTIFGW